VLSKSSLYSTTGQMLLSAMKQMRGKIGLLQQPH